MTELTGANWSPTCVKVEATGFQSFLLHFRCEISLQMSITLLPFLQLSLSCLYLHKVATSYSLHLALALPLHCLCLCL